MKAPIYFYYGINNFYQNHRWYVKSRSYGQLAGEVVDHNTLVTECDPLMTNKQAGRTMSWTQVILNPDDDVNPCGLVALSYFNDSYTI